MKYQDLVNELIQTIESGMYSESNNKFISERKISETYGVSRTTVRRAIEDLKRQGYLLSVHGKGTFVKRKEHSQSIFTVTRCSENYEEMGLHPTVKLLKKEIVPASAHMAESLKIPQGDQVVRLERLFCGDRTIFNVTVSYLPLTRFPEIRGERFEDISVLDFLRSRCQAYAKRTENYIEAVLPRPDIAESLRVTEKTPIILFESVTSGSYKNQFVPLEYFKCYYKTDSYRFKLIQEHDMFY